MNNNSSDLTIKKIFKYIFIFVLLCIFVYSLSGGMILVNAETYTGSISRPENNYYDINNLGFQFGHLFEFEINIDPELAQQKNEANEVVYSYSTYKYTYYYDITKSDVYSLHNLFKSGDFRVNEIFPYSCLEHPNDTYCVEQYDSFTSIDDDGKYYYTEFLTIRRNKTRFVRFIDFYFLLTNYADSYKVPDKAYVEAIDFGFADKKSELQPLTIQEIIEKDDNDYYDPEIMPYEDDDEDDSFFSKLIESIVKGIRDPIIKSWKRFKALFKHLFIPEKEVFKEGWLRNFNLFEEQLGIIFLPFELIETILNKYLNLGEGSGIIHIPTIKDPFYNQTIISSQDLNLKEIFSTGSLKDIHEIYLVVIDGLIIISLSSLAWKKFNSIFKSREGGE